MIARAMGNGACGDGFAAVYRLLRAAIQRALWQDEAFCHVRHPGLVDDDATDECLAIAWQRHYPRLIRKGFPAQAAALFAAKDAARDYLRGQRFTQTDSSQPLVDWTAEDVISQLADYLQPVARLSLAGLPLREIGRRVGLSHHAVIRRRAEIAAALR